MLWAPPRTSTRQISVKTLSRGAAVTAVISCIAIASCIARAEVIHLTTRGISTFSNLGHTLIFSEEPCEVVSGESILSREIRMVRRFAPLMRLHQDTAERAVGACYISYCKGVLTSLLRLDGPC